MRLKRIAPVLAAGGALAFFAVSPLSAEVIDLDASVSSDGAEIASMPGELNDVSPSFEGTLGAGAAAPLSVHDIRATGARPATPDELRRLRNAKPIRPSGSSMESGSLPGASVIGRDSRKRIGNTRAYPARATAAFSFDAGGGTALCTGWLINANTLVTAGHCVANGGSKRFFRRGSYVIAPGYNLLDNPDAPFGVCGARRLITNTTWLRRGRDDFDYAVIKLNCNIGTTVGWYGISKKSARRAAITIQGYPGDKGGNTQWYMRGRITTLQPRRVFYPIDTAGGQSGAPVWRSIKGCGICGVAIHAYGVGGKGASRRFNHGTRVNGPVFKSLTRWKKLR
jgi:glutamyl endopeptidase